MKFVDLPYDQLSRIVNECYERNANIGETIKETGLPFDLVWDMTGHKDYFDFQEDHWKE